MMGDEEGRPPFVFGMVVGASMGALVGSVCALLLGSMESLGEFAMWSAAFGVLVGAATVAMESYPGGRPGEHPDTATHVGLILGIAPGLVILLQAIGFVRGKFSGYLFIGMLFAGPMAGMLIGGVLDRIHDGFLPAKQPSEPDPGERISP